MNETQETTQAPNDWQARDAARAQKQAAECEEAAAARLEGQRRRKLREGTRDKATGNAALGAWEKMGDEAGAVPSGLMFSAVMLVEMAQDIQSGQFHFLQSEAAAARLMLEACEAAQKCIRRAVNQAGA